MDPFFTKILRGSWNKNDYCICNESCSSIFNFRLVIEQVLKNARWRLPVDEFSSLICLAQALTKKSSRSMLASALSSYLLKYHKQVHGYVAPKINPKLQCQKIGYFFRENSKASQFKSWNMLSCIHSWLNSKFFKSVSRKVKFLTLLTCQSTYWS